MTDKELLDYAAKAAGIELDWYGDGEPAIKENDENIDPIWAFMNPWNPLKDDGDALRLAVKLRLSIDIRPKAVCVITEGEKNVVMEANLAYSVAELTRRAIVIASAKIGKELP